MNIENIKTRANQTPFRPFALEISSGAKYSVLHPEFIMFGQEVIVVMEPNDIVRIVDCPHVVAIEDLNPRQAA